MNGSTRIAKISGAHSPPAPKARRASRGSIWALRIGDAASSTIGAGASQRFDLLLCPVLPTEAFPAKGPMPTEINGQPLKEPLNAVVFTYPFNMSGHPGASVRAGLTDAGLPCGLQIVAERHREDLVLQASYAYEQARPWNNKWPKI